MRIGRFAWALLALPLSAAAQPKGELWEITSQMNIPGMPAGMGAQTQRVCGGDDPERASAQSKDRQDCKVTDKKQTATRMTITMVCSRGTMTVDQQFNAARTEFKGTIKMAGKDGDMTMTTTGRKVGACDAQEARREREQQVAKAKSDSAKYQAQAAAQMKDAGDKQIQACQKALDAMDFRQFGSYNRESCAPGSPLQNVMKSGGEPQKQAFSSCCTKVSEFCSRLQTQQGFIKAKGDESAAKSCGLSSAKIKASLCPAAAKNESLAFLGRFCPVEAKPLAQVHCAGRDYTSAQGGKYADFCMSYLANADFEDSSTRSARRPAAAQAAGKDNASGAPAAGDAVNQGINEGLNKLKGLFGR